MASTIEIQAYRISPDSDNTIIPLSAKDAEQMLWRAGWAAASVTEELGEGEFIVAGVANLESGQTLIDGSWRIER